LVWRGIGGTVQGGHGRKSCGEDKSVKRTDVEPCMYFLIDKKK
jgi:hypothetical protein